MRNVLLLAFLATFASAKPEPWADTSLPVSQDLSIWLDATRQPTAWKAHAKPALGAGDMIDVCYDASGHARHFIQTVRASQPKLAAGDKSAAIRFDGENDFLHWTGGKYQSDRLTVIIAAAPKSNAGFFRGFFAAHDLGKNDYTSGINIDMGPAGSADLSVLNAEGRGFHGFANLLKTPTPFRKLNVIAVTVDADVKLFLNGKPEGSRTRTAGPIGLGGMYLGARCYSNDAMPPFVSGHLDGDIAEILVYERALGDKEITDISAYLTKKHAAYNDELAKSVEGGELLQSLPNPPEVQVFVPGFEAHRLPLDLTNINNLRYREDGKLVAVAYDGNIHLLSDTDNDGLEDKADIFWNNKGDDLGDAGDRGSIVTPIGAALTPPGYKLGRGVFVACKGKVSLLLDADGDDKAEKEVIVAQGWRPLAHQVDALGVAVAPDGSVYFGLGTTNFTNAYLTDGKGNAKYDINDERGTILRVSPDFKSREIVATGIRFPVGLAFNARGDLFATDQEGATWLANGNPLDELLHIEKGRHYGFPPRHPKHLPNVIDEPSVFDYGPQHQSTCGVVFNEGAVFGPASWRGDVFVCGESRGKVYRTQLVKTAAGYVARNHLVASITALVVDAAISPKGDMVVATHGGMPDWGSGPKGKGVLYKLRYRDQAQPVAIYPSAPRELRITFDREIDPAVLRDARKSIRIDHGQHVAAGDRFEKLRPGYAVVNRQMNSPRQRLDITGAAITNDRRTVVLSTSPQTRAGGYAIMLPWPRQSGGIKQVEAIDLAYDLSGVIAEWQGDNGAKWSGWIPHLDLDVSRAFLAGSVEHDQLWIALKTPGKLVLKTSLDLRNMLRPAVQEGEKIDHTWPAEKITVTLDSNLPTRSPRSFIVAPKEDELTPLEIVLTTGLAEPKLTIAYTTAEDDRKRAVPLRRFVLPWVSTKPTTETLATNADLPQLKGGDWKKGRDIFFSGQAGCSLCHRINGKGSDVGPDLSNLVHRDYDSVLRDIQNPSAALNPDHIASTVRLKDGSVYNGIIRGVGDKFIVRGDYEGEAEPISREQVASITPSAVSLMPPGLDQGLGAQKTRDLMMFLLTRPLEPAAIERPGPPLARSRGEVEAAIANSAPLTNLKPLSILLVAGPKDHGPSEHDYPAWQRRWATLLRLADNVTVSTADRWPTADQWKAADVAVFYSANPDWNADKTKDIDAHLAKGGGLVFIHFAVNGQNAVEPLADRIGLAWRNGGSRFRHGALELTLREHEITRGMSKVKFIDESYWNLVGDPKRVNLLGSGSEDGAERPLIWTHEQGGGRVFVFIPGHFSWTFDDPLFRLLVLRGVAWTANQPVDRFNDVVTIGARVTE